MRRVTFENSGTLTWAAYNQDEQTLDLGFVQGGRYRYFLVPSHVFDGLIAADSAGRYFLDHIRNTYPCREVK